MLQRSKEQQQEQIPESPEIQEAKDEDIDDTFLLDASRGGVCAIAEPRFSWPRPAVIRVGGASYHPGRAFPTPGDYSQRYLVGRQYWRLLSYVQGLWPSMASMARVPHVAVTGIAGCGKSWTFAAVASFLRQKKLASRYRVVCVADCERWLEAADPLGFFAMELLIALRDDSDPALDVVKSRLICGPDELRPWLGVIDDWLERHNEDSGSSPALSGDGLQLIVILDQVEALLGKSEALPNQVIQALIDMRNSIVVMGLTTDGPSERTAMATWGFSRLGFHQLHLPFHLPNTDYTTLADMLLDIPLSLHEAALLREARLYTGGVIRELASCLTFDTASAAQSASGAPEKGKRPPGVDLTTRIDCYRRTAIDRAVRLVEEAISKLDRVQRVAFLLIVFRMILRLPADAATSSVILPSAIRALFLPAAVQRFYHPRDAVAVIHHIPTALSLSVHLALGGPRVLGMLGDSSGQNQPLSVMHKLISSIMDSKTVCGESKRRMIRFYTLYRLNTPSAVRLRGVTDFDREVEVEVPEVHLAHHFAGLTPAKDILAWLLAQAIIAGDSATPLMLSTPTAVSPSTQASLLRGDLSRAIPIVLIPGRTDYCFFDFFYFMPATRRLYAVGTAAGPSDWQRFGASTQALAGNRQKLSVSPAIMGGISGGTAPGPSPRDNIVTPTVLVDMWTRLFREVLPTKFTVHCVYVQPLDMLAAAGCPWQQPAVGPQ